jgi:hypothetical protein
VPPNSGCVPAKPITNNRASAGSTFMSKSGSASVSADRLMHRHITHNKCYGTFREFSTAMLTFLREDVPKNWRDYRDEVTDNFRVITPTEFRIIA